MHEVSVARAVVEAVLQQTGDEQVESVTVALGAMSGVSADSLELSWQLATEGTSLAGSTLVVEHVPVTVFCDHCQAVVTPDVGLACPACATVSDEVRDGLDLRVVSARLVAS